MKRTWNSDELVEQWTLLPHDVALVDEAKTASNRLGLAVLLMWFQHEGRFPTHQHDVPTPVLVFLATQVDVAPDVFATYDWHGRTCECHRASIRQALGFREATIQDADALSDWLVQTHVAHQRHLDALKAIVYERCRSLRIEPPAAGRIDRLIRSTIHTYDDHLCHAVMARLPSEVRARLDALLVVPLASDADPATAQSTARGHSLLYELKMDAGRVSRDTMLIEMQKLHHIRALGLPTDLFPSVPPNVLEAYRQRIAVEELHEIRRHPDPIRATLLAAYCLV